MSLAGRNQLRGDDFTVYRATQSDAGGGETTRAWASVLASRAVFETLSHELAQRLYGVIDEVTLRAKIDASPIVRPEDGVTIATGEHAGRYLVHAAPARVTHRELVLLVTTQEFP